MSRFLSQISACATYCLSLCLAWRLGHNGNAQFMRVIHRDISRRDISETVSHHIADLDLLIDRIEAIGDQSKRFLAEA
jgi:hypothetical protein